MTDLARAFDIYLLTPKYVTPLIKLSQVSAVRHTRARLLATQEIRRILGTQA